MTPKPQEFTVMSCAQGKLHVKFGAKIRLEDSFRLLDEVRQIAAREEVGRLLLDVTAYQVKLNVMQRLQLALAVVAKLRSYRVAAVFSSATFDPQRIGETMAVNRGAKLKVFTDLVEAAAWLEAQPSAGPEAGRPQT